MLVTAFIQCCQGDTTADRECVGGGRAGLLEEEVGQAWLPTHSRTSAPVLG